MLRANDIHAAGSEIVFKKRSGGAFPISTLILFFVSPSCIVDLNHCGNFD